MTAVIVAALMLVIVVSIGVYVTFKQLSSSTALLFIERRVHRTRVLSEAKLEIERSLQDLDSQLDNL